MAVTAIAPTIIALAVGCGEGDQSAGPESGVTVEDVEEEGVPPVRYDRYEKYETEEFIYDARVEQLATP